MADKKTCEDYGYDSKRVTDVPGLLCLKITVSELTCYDCNGSISIGGQCSGGTFCSCTNSSMKNGHPAHLCMPQL